MPSEHKTNETIKYKLATAMKECMKSASVEKITVTEIVETCGVTRQTFYRNFKDKYDLINWYFDKILLESFEHMGEGKTVYEGLVNKFHYIQQEKLFFKAAFKNDDQNCLRDHDFQLICAFYAEQLETRMACRLSTAAVSVRNVLPGFHLYDRTVGAWLSQMFCRRTRTCPCICHAGRTADCIS